MEDNTTKLAKAFLEKELSKLVYEKELGEPTPIIELGLMEVPKHIYFRNKHVKMLEYLKTLVNKDSPFED